MGVYTAINDPSAYFQNMLYTGNGSSGLAITNTGNSNLQPDWLWIKQRANTGNNSNGVWDSTRGASSRLITDVNTAAESQTNVASFNTDGFTVNTGNIVNANSGTYVAWQWKANGGTTSSVGVGSITTTVQANTTSGFSIISYTGNGVNGATIGHGLGVAPKVIFVKDRSSAESWQVFHGARTNPEQKFIELDANSTGVTNANRWSNTAPTSSIINLGNGNSVNKNSDNYIAYCFAEKQGFSHFGKYRGNGNADGPFVHTGFKPAWVMIKRADSNGNWYIYDTERNGGSGPNTNQAHKILYANDSSGEVVNTDRGIDMTANGFKIRNTLGDTNASAGSYLTFAFATHPFVSSAGVPATAR
jgi:hypothetical protein